jgi:hypothetical protein
MTRPIEAPDTPQQWVSASLMSNSKYFGPWLIQHHCNAWKWAVLHWFQYPGNVLNVDSTLEDYEAALQTQFDPDLLVYRSHLDQIILKTERSLRIHVNRCTWGDASDKAVAEANRVMDTYTNIFA